MLYIIAKSIMYIVIGHILYTHDIKPENHMIDFITFISSVLMLDILSFFNGKFSNPPTEEE